MAYVGEYGLETEDQSSLNLVNFIGTDLSKPFQIFGDSDEAWRIEGGSSKLIKALVDALKDKIEMNLGYALNGLDLKNEQIVMSFDAPGGTQQRYLRRSDPRPAIHLPAPRQGFGPPAASVLEKLKCINELGMGQQRKDHGWHQVAGVAEPPRSPTCRCPPMAASVPILRFQDFWETSRAQPGEAGILTVFLGGNAARPTRSPRSTAFRAGLAKMSPKMAESLDPAAVTSMFWSNYRYTLGSYTGAKVGQYTTMLDEAGKPALDGRLQFAGEHTERRKVSSAI